MQDILEGNIAVKAAIQAGHRVIEQLLVDEHKQDRDTRYIVRLAKDRKIAVTKLPRNQIDALAKGKTHGGLLAYCHERAYQSLDAYVGRDRVFLALLEGIEDPYNFASALRSLYAAGCEGVIVSPRNWTSATDVVAKASAGASELIDLIKADDMNRTIVQLKSQGISLVCAQRCDDAQSIFTYQFPKRLCLAVGGEMRGLSKSVRCASDQNIYIPYGNSFRNAMSAASSCAILAFEHLRQTIERTDKK